MSNYTDYEANDAQADVELLNQLMQMNTDMQAAIDATINSLDKFNWSIGLTEQDVRDFFDGYTEEEFSSDLMVDLLYGRDSTQRELADSAAWADHQAYINDNRTY